ncbi:MAG TPA: ACT domain-containing protein [Streptosporangiaceae bacterium]
MKYVVLYGPPGDLAQAREYFPDHRAWYEKFRDRGLLLMIGAFADAGAPAAMAVFTTREAAEEFVAGDPFVVNGVLREWTVREWNEALVPAAREAREWGDIEPRLHAEPYVFVSVAEVPPGIQPFAVIREDEGTTLVTTRDEADRAGLSYGYVAARITLTINSSLSDVGLTAAVSRVLADAGISCNVIAGLAHDHLFVEAGRGPEAAALLRDL